MNIFYKQSAEGKSLRVCTLPFILFLAIVACNHDVPTPEGETVETPRRIAAADGKLYVSCYRPASVIRIDTASHTVEAQCLLGTCNPEGVAVAAGSLFVASSWNQTSNGDFIYDDKVYVVDLTSFAVSATVTVGLNPQQVKVIDENHVIVNYEGNYADLPGGTAIIDVASLDVTQTGLHMASMSVCDGKVYGYSTSYDSDMHPTAEYVCYDPATATATPILRDCGVTRPYSINVFGGNIYLTTDGGYTSNGDVQCTANAAWTSPRVPSTTRHSPPPTDVGWATWRRTCCSTAAKFMSPSVSRTLSRL